MKINPDTCTDPSLLAREVRRLQSLLDEIRTAADQADVEYRAEIARLRLTDAEREAIETAMNAYGSDNANPECAAIEATLWGLLERTK